MKKIYGSFILVLFSLIIKAEKVDVILAQQVATSFVQSKIGTQKSNAPLLVLNSQFTSARTNAPIMYVFDVQPAGFVIMSADNDIIPVVGYSFEDNYVMNPNLNYWLNSFKAVAEYKLLEKSINEANRNAWKEIQAGNSKSLNGGITNLLQTSWSQGKYYNAMCPVDAAGDDGHALTGCVATSMAQIIKYWEYPSVGTRTCSYTSQNYGLLSAKYDTTTYNWENMRFNELLDYNSSVANLMYQCGVSVFMNYGPHVSGAQSSQVTNALQLYFGFNNNIKQIEKAAYSTLEWDNIMRAQLNKRCPVLYSGYDVKSSSTDTAAGGHAWVMDGYQDSAYFHMNWGWGKYSNGNFYRFSENLIATPGVNFNTDQRAIINIYPKNYVGIEENNQNVNNVNVFPNPTNNNLNISFNSSKTAKIDIAIFDLLGKELLKKHSSVIMGSNIFDVDCSSLSKGTYIIRMISDDSVKTMKFNKE